MRKQKLIATLLTAAMLISLVVVPAAAKETDNWYDEAMTTWADYGVIQGDANGDLNPEGKITRGELAVILDRLMDYQLTAKNTFTDVKANQWYTDAILAANAAGIVKGDGPTARPLDQITREEAAVMFARVLSLSGEAGASAGYTDEAAISGWAMDAVKSMSAKGYLKGSDGTFRPKDPITRAEVMTILNNVFQGYYNAKGTYSEVVRGTALISAAGVTMKNTKISGDLILAEGVADGEVTLDGVTVAGKLIVRGGGENSIIIKGASSIANVVVSRQDGKVRVSVEGSAKVETIVVADGSDAVKVEGTVNTVTVDGAGAAVEITGTVKNVNVAQAAQGAALTVTKTAKVTNLNTAAEGASLAVAGTVTTVKVADTAADTKVDVAKGATVAKVETAGNGTAITGDGSVKNVDVTAGDGTTVKTPGTKVEVDKNAGGVTTDKGEVKPGTTGSNTGSVPGTSTGGGGGGGGGGSSTPTAPFSFVMENFNAHNGEDYKGIAVGWKFDKTMTKAYFEQMSKLEIQVYGATGNALIAHKTVNPAGYYDYVDSGLNPQYSTGIGSAGDVNFVDTLPLDTTKGAPTKAVVTITMKNGAVLTQTNSAFTGGDVWDDVVTYYAANPNTEAGVIAALAGENASVTLGGDCIITGSVTIDEGDTLIVPTGYTLTVKGTLTNNGTLTSNGVLAGEGTVEVKDIAPLRMVLEGNSIKNVKLIGDIVIDAPIEIPMSRTVILNLNGKQVTTSMVVDGVGGPQESMVTSFGNLTIDGTVAGSKMTTGYNANPGTEQIRLLRNIENTMTIKGGEYVGHYAVETNSKTVNGRDPEPATTRIEDAKIIGGFAGITNWGNGTIVLKDTNVTANYYAMCNNGIYGETTFDVTGGKFESTGDTAIFFPAGDLLRFTNSEIIGKSGGIEAFAGTVELLGTTTVTAKGNYKASPNKTGEGSLEEGSAVVVGYRLGYKTAETLVLNIAPTVGLTSTNGHCLRVISIYGRGSAYDATQGVSAIDITYAEGSLLASGTDKDKFANETETQGYGGTVTVNDVQILPTNPAEPDALPTKLTGLTVSDVKMGEVENESGVCFAVDGVPVDKMTMVSHFSEGIGAGQITEDVIREEVTLATEAWQNEEYLADTDAKTGFGVPMTLLQSPAAGAQVKILLLSMGEDKVITHYGIVEITIPAVVVLSLKDVNLEEQYDVNLETSDNDAREYFWGVRFTCGEKKYEVGTSHYKPPVDKNPAPGTKTLAEMQTDLWLMTADETGGEVIDPDVVLSIEGKTLTWTFTRPEGMVGEIQRTGDKIFNITQQ